MKSKAIIPFLITLALNLSLSLQAKNHPNIILILADDLGYGDLSCYGAPDLKTPALDKLASQGVKLTQFYANAPECTPTRTALLTGRYQQRVGGLECAIGLGEIGRYTEAKALSDKGELGLPSRYSQLPRGLHASGYQTALIGKWHLGAGADFVPSAHSFDYSIGPLGGAIDYFHHTEPIGEFIGTYMHGDHDFLRNGQPHQRDGYYLTHLITDEAVEWIQNRSAQRPFFLYLPYTVPHEPLQTPEDYSENPITMEHWGAGDRKEYISMVEDFDKGIGKILAKLDEKGIADDTLVIFFSDNGPTSDGNTAHFRGHKGHVFEGGIRVPFIARWPGKIKAGQTVTDPYISMDVTASLLNVAQAKPKYALDGIDLLEHIAHGKSPDPRPLFWRKKRADQIRSAARSGHLKYIQDVSENQTKEYLFDLENDPAESRDLSDSRPADLARMKALLQKWSDEVQPERYN